MYRARDYTLYLSKTGQYLAHQSPDLTNVCDREQPRLFYSRTLLTLQLFLDDC